MKKLLPALLLALLPLAAFAQETVERIEIVGNDRVTKETILYYLSAREGDYFNEELLKRDFRVLWSTGFFANVRIERAEGTKGKIIRIVVEENPVIKTVVYKTGKKVKEDDIVNKLKEKDEYILPYSYYSPAKVQKIKRTIGDLLAEKGLQAAKIDTEVARKGKNEVDLTFRIDEGPKVRVGEVVFEGRSKLPESALREAMKDNKTHNVLSWIGGKDVFKQNKIPDDVELIKKRFQENGYMEATVGEPRIETIEKRTIFFRKQKMMRLVIPVHAGYLYRVGEIKVEGNKAVNGKYLRSLVKLEKGQVYSTQVREKAIEKMGETYRDGGYLYAQVAPVESLDPKRKVVNVTFNVYEGEVAFLHRLEFRGNNYTKDKVIRREMLIREGDRFSLAYFKDSILRIKQLGLVDLEKEPDIKPNPEDPAQIDVQVNVKELQRNNIQFTAGYSGYEGTFVALSYSTVNFLGAGETLEFMVQTGKRVKNYSFGFTEPYLFDQPITLGFNVFDRRIDYPYLYNQKSRGADLTIGARLFGYWRANVTYSYQNVNVSVPRGQRVLWLLFRVHVRRRELQYQLDRAAPLPFDGRQPADPHARDDVLPVVQVRRLVPRRRDQPLPAEARVRPFPAVHRQPRDRPPHGIPVCQAPEGVFAPVLGEVLSRRRALHPGLRDLYDRPPKLHGSDPRRRQVLRPQRGIHHPHRRAALGDPVLRHGKLPRGRPEVQPEGHVHVGGPGGPGLRPGPEGSVPADFRV